MNQKLILNSALASALSLGLIGQAAAADDMATKGDKAKEKCYGVAKAGQNDCANLSGTHACAGMTKADSAPDDWKYVAKGTCKEMKGLTAEEAKAKLKKS